MNRKRELLAGTVAAVGYAIYRALSTPRIQFTHPSPATYQSPPKQMWQTNAQMKELTIPLLSPNSSTPPYALTGFGLDITRNQAPLRRLDEFHELPLQGLGRTILNEGRHQEVLESPVTVSKVPGVRVKFLRFSVLSVRNGGPAVSVGGFRFLYNQSQIRDDQMILWNPHTGERLPYNGEEWSDSNHRMGVFVFTNPVDITRYQIQTSHEDPGLDPINWTLEGSLNGTYWIPLDARNTNAIPIERKHWMNFLIGDVL